MSELEPTSTVAEESATPSKARRLSVPGRAAIGGILAYALVGAFIFGVLEELPLPFLAVSLFVFGLSPAFAIVTSVGALRGALAGFLCGYLGAIINGLVFYRAIPTFTLQAMAYGIAGLVVGLFHYDFTRGRSLAKLSVISVIGYLGTVLVSVGVGLLVEGSATLVVLGFVLLPMLSLGIPSVALLTPLFVRIWVAIASKFRRGAPNQP